MLKLAASITHSLKNPVNLTYNLAHTPLPKYNFCNNRNIKEISNPLNIHLSFYAFESSQPWTDKELIKISLCQQTAHKARQLIYNHLKIEKESDLQLVDSIFFYIRNFKSTHIEFTKKDCSETVGISFSGDIKTLIEHNFKEQSLVLRDHSYTLRTRIATFFDDFEDDYKDFGKSSKSYGK